MFAIAGSGFGLYGYLPALIDGLDETVVLPNKYRETFEGRKELLPYRRSIVWAKDMPSALNMAKGIVIAIRPMEQASFVGNCLQLRNIQYLVLEKPLTPDPQSAQELLDNLIRSRKNFLIGYIFLYLPSG